MHIYIIHIGGILGRERAERAKRADEGVRHGRFGGAFFKKDLSSGIYVYIHRNVYGQTLICMHIFVYMSIYMFIYLLIFIVRFNTNK